MNAKDYEMLIKKKLLIGVSAFVLALTFTTAPAFAVVETEEPKPTTTTTTTKETPTQATKETPRCTTAETRIKKQLTTIQTVREARSKVYKNTLERVEKVIASAKERTYDTTKLDAALVAAQTAYDSFVTNSTNYETALTSTQTYACGNSEGQFANALATARTELTTLRTSAATLRSTIREQLVPAVKEYAVWLKAQASTKTSTTEGDAR